MLRQDQSQKYKKTVVVVQVVQAGSMSHSQIRLILISNVSIGIRVLLQSVLVVSSIPTMFPVAISIGHLIDMSMRFLPIGKIMHEVEFSRQALNFLHIHAT